MYISENRNLMFVFMVEYLYFHSKHKTSNHHCKYEKQICSSHVDIFSSDMKPCRFTVALFIALNFTNSKSAAATSL